MKWNKNLSQRCVFPLCSFLQVDESVFCAGQIALVPCTLQLMKAGTRGQAHLSFSHVKKVLEASISGLTLAHVVQAHCYTTRHRDIPVVRAVWESMLTAAEEEQVSPCAGGFLFNEKCASRSGEELRLADLL